VRPSAEPVAGPRVPGRPPPTSPPPLAVPAPSADEPSPPPPDFPAPPVRPLRSGPPSQSLSLDEPKHRRPSGRVLGVLGGSLLVVAAVVVVLVVVVDLRGAIGFSSVTVLTYYALANASALTLPARRRGTATVALVGLIGCLVLAVALPLASLLAGAVVLAAGVTARRVTRWARSRRGHASQVSPS
jgi:hypothetical protein